MTSEAAYRRFMQMDDKEAGAGRAWIRDSRNHGLSSREVTDVINRGNSKRWKIEDGTDDGTTPYRKGGAVKRR